MLDLSHIPNSQQDIKIFYSTGDTNAWQTWQKPRKCQWVWIMCIGSGGSGGGGNIGFSGAFSTGGASGGVVRALFNASHLPDTLYVQVGVGGTPGTLPSSNGNPGKKSYVSIQPNTTTTNTVVTSGTAAAIGGQSAASANSAGETAATITPMVFGSLANFISTAGVTSVFALQSQPININPLQSEITCQGAGGASMQTSDTVATLTGGSILASSISSLIQGGLGANTSGSNGGNGADGITSWKPFFSTGGAGGGAAVSGSGGNGGNGGIGSGGGGGGRGNGALGYTGGFGGSGGDGLVVIITF